jgi:hypothetical protein
MYKIIIIILGILAFGGQSIQAQVGINTTSPQEDLDIDGTLRIRNTGTINSSKILGRDSNGTVGTIDVGDNVVINNNTIHATGSSDYGIINVVLLSFLPNQLHHNLDLQLTGNNLFKTVIRITGPLNSFDITGIAGGTDGRHILLLNMTTNNMAVRNEHLGSIAANRINALAGGPGESTSGQGAIELVYDGVLARWLVLDVRK